MTARPRPPRLGRWLLRARPLGSRRSEVEADLAEMFAHRAEREGGFRAALRYYVDVLSIWRWNPSGARVFREAAQDLRYGLRVFRRTPGPVAITIAGLALAIGVSTAVFSLLHATLFAPVGVAEPRGAVNVERVWERGVTHGWAYSEYLALKAMSRETTVEATTIIAETASVAMAAPNVLADEPPRAPTAIVSGTYMSTFGARPLHGRILTAADDISGAEPVAVLGYTYWVRRLGSDPSVIGRPLWVNGKPVTVVGVLERRFTGITDEPPGLWMTFAGARAADRDVLSESGRMVALVARLPFGVTLTRAEAQVGALAAAVGRDRADPYRTTGVKVVPASDRPGVKGTAPMVALLMSAVGLVMVLACVNVASLQIAGAFARQREIGVRLALGASRGRIVRQLVTESITLGLAAGALGLVLTRWLAPLMARIINVPMTYDVVPGARAYALLTLLSCAAGIAAGLAPARYGARGDVLTPLKGDGPRIGPSGRPGRARAVLVGVQAAASVVLLIVASLAAHAAIRAASIDVGLDVDRLLTIAHNVGQADAAKTFLDTALDRVRAAPGVEAASLTDAPPYSGGFIGMNFNRGGEQIRAFLAHTDAQYFSTVGLRILKGRSYSAREVAAGAPVAVVSETLARRLWGTADPIGQSLDEFAKVEKAPRVTIIGVVADHVPARLYKVRTAAIYRPLTLLPVARIVVRTSTPPATVLPALRASLQSIDPRVRISATLAREGLRKELDLPRTFASVAGSIAALALALAAIGIYGVTAFVAGLRTREIGVRIAVGASRGEVVRLLLRDSLRPIAIGLACGVGAALLAAQAFAGAMYGVTARDPLAFVTATGTLLLAATFAAYVPTRRASRLDPVSVLRQQ